MSELQRPPAEVLYAEELAMLASQDLSPRPPGWRLSPPAVRAFLLGDPERNVRPKFVGNPSLVDRAMVALATQRGLLLVGEPGTAKSLLSELLAAAVSGQSTLTIQGSAATTEDQLKYGWNYALLLAEGPSRKALVPAPLFLGMEQGKLVRFEEITRCPLEIQDGLLSILSDRVLFIPELKGDENGLYARQGFNVLATANTRDRGTHEMSSALKRRFNFETVYPIADPQEELALVESETRRQLQASGVGVQPPRELLEVLVTTFRELRSGVTTEGQALERLSTSMSTAEAVSVAQAMGIRAHYLAGREAGAEDLMECILGTALKDNQEDTQRLRRYLEQRVRRHRGQAWKAFYEARHRLP
ncbi:AAA family ATPase [bacterium]|nr:AAA family ATPase [bacterium]